MKSKHVPIIHDSWQRLLDEEFNKPYFIKLNNFLDAERQKITVFPPARLTYAAMELTPFDNVKVVILGQDPYHDYGQAMGLAFSVNNGVPHPPSLRNIFKELSLDQAIAYPMSGNLEPWAKQGVLLLNTTLTVRAHQAASHQKQGWETFTDEIIRIVSTQKEHVVFILWGRYAQEKQVLIDVGKHLILKSVHPSPLSAHNGFWGSKPFSKANAYLKDNGLDEIDWNLI